MKHLVVGLVLVVVALVAIGCGEAATSGIGDTNAVTDAADAVEQTASDVAEVEMEPTLSEDEVTAFFAAERDRKASRVEPNSGAATIGSEVPSCTLLEPGPSYGKARCIEEVTYDYPPLPRETETMIWMVAYDETTGEVVSYRQLD